MGAVEEEVKRLHGFVSSLEARIKTLEERQFGSPKSAEEVRMILIGPPGAGMCTRLVHRAQHREA